MMQIVNEHRQQIRTWLVGIVAALAIIGATVSGYLAGYRYGERAERQVEVDQLVLEGKIIKWITERNPDASIKDFQDFPAFLLKTSAAAGIDYRLVLAMADKESQFRATAIGRDGEIGILQILPATAAEVVKKLPDIQYEPPVMAGKIAYRSLGSLGDPKLNVRIGIEYFRWQIERYGLNPVAIRAYNRHPDRALEIRPRDRYAEDIALKYIVLVHALENPRRNF